MKKLLSPLLIIFFLALFGYYFSHNIDDFKSLLHINPWLTILVALGFMGSLYTAGLFIKQVLLPFKIKISTKESFYISVLSAIGNYFGPLLGGAGIRAVYLKKKVGLSYTDFLSTLYGYYIIVFLVNGVVGLIALLFSSNKFQSFNYLSLMAFFIVDIVIVLLIISGKSPKVIEKFMGKLFRRQDSSIKKFFSSWEQIKAHPKLIKSLIFIAFVNLALLVFIAYCEFLIIDVNLELSALLLYSVIGSFSILVSFTPGALGIREGLFIFSAGILGVGSSEILKVAVIDRSIQFIVMSVCWIILIISKRQTYDTE